MKFFDGANFKKSPLSSLVNNLAKAIDKSKCNDYDIYLEYEVSRTSQ